MLRVIVGGLLLIFALQWLRKAILRSAGLKAKHDESQIYEEAAAAHARQARAAGFDGYAFTISLRACCSRASRSRSSCSRSAPTAPRPARRAAAALAVLLVIVAGVAARAPLAKVPENTMKFAVGVMLSSFGMFWGAEGAGASWPGGDAALLAIIPAVLIAAIAMS